EWPRQRPRQQIEDRAAVDLLADERGADREYDEEPEPRHRGQPEVHGEPQPLPHGKRAREAGDPEQHETTGDDAREHAVAHHLAERVPRDEQRGECAHACPRDRSAWNAELSAAAMNSSSSEGRNGVTDRTAMRSARSQARRSWTQSASLTVKHVEPPESARRTEAASRVGISSTREPSTRTSTAGALPSTSSPTVATRSSRPSSRIATRSHSASTSGRMCEEKSTVVPLARCSRISSRTSRRPNGSSPLIGSSRTRSSGSWIIAAASP